MKTVLDDWVIIGRFGRPHGVRGLIKVHSFTDPADTIVQYLPWHVLVHDHEKLIAVSDVTVREKHILVSIENISDRTKVAEFTNLDIVMPNTRLPALANDEYYWHELIGMQVTNREAEDFGQVGEIIATGSNDVLVVEGDRRRLIPYLPGQFIDKIDRSHRQIIVDWDKDF